MFNLRCYRAPCRSLQCPRWIWCACEVAAGSSCKLISALFAALCLCMRGPYGASWVSLLAVDLPPTATLGSTRLAEVANICVTPYATLRTTACSCRLYREAWHRSARSSVSLSLQDFAASPRPFATWTGSSSMTSSIRWGGPFTSSSVASVLSSMINL